MNATEHRERILDRLLSEVEDAEFPNTTTLNRIETSLHTHEAISRYAEALAKKIEATQYPSTTMVQRLDNALTRLEQAEQRQDQRRQKSEDG